MGAPHRRSGIRLSLDVVGRTSETPAQMRRRSNWASKANSGLWPSEESFPDTRFVRLAKQNGEKWAGRFIFISARRSHTCFAFSNGSRLDPPGV